MLRDLFSLFPAYAGVIQDSTVYKQSNISFPRIRGGDPTNAGSLALKKSFSPHTRG